MYPALQEVHKYVIVLEFKPPLTPSVLKMGFKIVQNGNFDQ
jgi:hypothetical protein